MEFDRNHIMAMAASRGPKNKNKNLFLGYNVMLNNRTSELVGSQAVEQGISAATTMQVDDILNSWSLQKGFNFTQKSEQIVNE